MKKDHKRAKMDKMTKTDNQIEETNMDDKELA